MVKGRVYYDYKSMDGFRRLLVAFSSSSSSLPSSSLRSTHTIYCKKHEVRKDSTLTPNNKTIFSLGWPPYCNKEDIANLFSRVGHVVNVYLLSSPGTVDEYTCRSDSQGFKVSYIVFSTEDEAESALKLCLTPDPILCPINLVGVRKWAREYDLLHPSMEALEMDAEMGVALYDQQQKEAELVRSRLNKADEDGWITITRKTPRGMVSDTHSLLLHCTRGLSSQR